MEYIIALAVVALLYVLWSNSSDQEENLTRSELFDAMHETTSVITRRHIW